MHEFSLYGTVAKADYGRLRQQLTGIARMQPQEVEELHVILKARPPVGLNNLPSAGGSQGVLQQDVQRVKTMLNSNLYYVQLVGQLPKDRSTDDNDISMVGADDIPRPSSHVKWDLEFKDTPDAGKQSVCTRLTWRIPLETGDFMAFLDSFGYEYVARYVVQGCKFYDQNTTLFLYRPLKLSPPSSPNEAAKVSSIPPCSTLQCIEPGEQYILQASIDVDDGNHPELKDRATKQLLDMKQSLKQAVNLLPGDRLALDTKVPLTRR